MTAEYILNKPSIGITASGRHSEKGFTVNKGSKARKDSVKCLGNCKQHSPAKRDEEIASLVRNGKLADKGDYYEFLEDCTFNSPSHATVIIWSHTGVKDHWTTDGIDDKNNIDVAPSKKTQQKERKRETGASLKKPIPPSEEQKQKLEESEPKPTAERVMFWLNQFNMPENEHYRRQEELIRVLFDKDDWASARLCEEKKELIKIAVLDHFYSVHTKDHVDLPTLAKRLVEMRQNGLVERLHNNNDKYDDIKEITICANATGDIKHIYSFATKYAHHHNQNKYPLFDKYVDTMLRYYIAEDEKFKEFTGTFKITKPQNSHENYNHFVNALNRFVEVFVLVDSKTGKPFTITQIDKYLWLAGKEYFTKPSKRKNKTSD